MKAVLSIEKFLMLFLIKLKAKMELSQVSIKRKPKTHPLFFMTLLNFKGMPIEFLVLAHKKL